MNTLDSLGRKSYYTDASVVDYDICKVLKKIVHNCNNLSLDEKKDLIDYFCDYNNELLLKYWLKEPNDLTEQKKRLLNDVLSKFGFNESFTILMSIYHLFALHGSENEEKKSHINFIETKLKDLFVKDPNGLYRLYIDTFLNYSMKQFLERSQSIVYLFFKTLLKENYLNEFDSAILKDIQDDLCNSTKQKDYVYNFETKKLNELPSVFDYKTITNCQTLTFNLDGDLYTYGEYIEIPLNQSKNKSLIITTYKLMDESKMYDKPTYPEQVIALFTDINGKHHLHKFCFRTKNIEEVLSKVIVENDSLLIPVYKINKINNKIQQITELKLKIRGRIRKVESKIKELNEIIKESTDELEKARIKEREEENLVEKGRIKELIQLRIKIIERERREIDSLEKQINDLYKEIDIINKKLSDALEKKSEINVESPAGQTLGS